MRRDLPQNFHRCSLAIGVYMHPWEISDTYGVWLRQIAEIERGLNFTAGNHYVNLDLYNLPPGLCNSQQML